MSDDQNPHLQILRRRDVEKWTGLRRATIYERIRDRTFPLPISLGPKSVGWIRSEVEEWIAERIKLSRPGPAKGISVPGTDHSNG